MRTSSRDCSQCGCLDPKPLPNNRYCTHWIHARLNNMSDSADDFLDSVEGEIIFFRSVTKARPVGLHKHFHVLAIRNAIHNETGRVLPVESIWAKLKTCYDLDALETAVSCTALSVLFLLVSVCARKLMVLTHQPPARIQHHTSYDLLRLPRTSHDILSFEMNIPFLMRTLSIISSQSVGYVQRPPFHHQRPHHPRASPVNRKRPRPRNVVRARRTWLAW